MTADRCEIIESAWLLRPELAKSLMPEPEPAVVGPSGGGAAEGASSGGGTTVLVGDDDWQPGAGGGAKIVEGERRLDRARVAMTVSWENWNDVYDVYNDVIDPLAREGAEVRCDVVILAQKGRRHPREHGRTRHQGITEPARDRGGYSGGVKLDCRPCRNGVS